MADGSAEKAKRTQSQWTHRRPCASPSSIHGSLYSILSRFNRIQQARSPGADPATGWQTNQPLAHRDCLSLRLPPATAGTPQRKGNTDHRTTQTDHLLGSLQLTVDADPAQQVGGVGSPGRQEPAAGVGRAPRQRRAVRRSAHRGSPSIAAAAVPLEPAHRACGQIGSPGGGHNAIWTQSRRKIARAGSATSAIAPRSSQTPPSPKPRRVASRHGATTITAERS